jgi:hypothetical protein
MKPLIGLIALLFATSAFAQTAPPRAAKRPPAQLKPQAPMGCKLVGTVRGTKLWAGECADAASAPVAPPPPSPAAPPPSDVGTPGEKKQ